MATITKKTPVTIGLMILGIVTAFWVGMSYQGMDNRMASLEGKFDSLVPRAELVAIQTELAEQKKDSWSKSDDLAFMREICHANNLVMSDHERIAAVPLENFLNSGCSITPKWRFE